MSNPPAVATPFPDVPLAGPHDDAAMALIAALGSALELKAEAGAPALTPNSALAASPVVKSGAEMIAPSASPPSLRAPLQRPVFERFASTPARPPAPRPEPARAVPSLATMSARPLPQPTPKAAVVPPLETADANQILERASPLSSPPNTLLGHLPKAEAKTAPVPEAVATPAERPALQTPAVDSLEAEMARLLGRPSNGA